MFVFVSDHHNHDTVITHVIRYKISKSEAIKVAKRRVLAEAAKRTMTDHGAHEERERLVVELGANIRSTDIDVDSGDIQVAMSVDLGAQAADGGKLGAAASAVLQDNGVRMTNPMFNGSMDSVEDDDDDDDKAFSSTARCPRALLCQSRDVPTFNCHRASVPRSMCD